MKSVYPELDIDLFYEAEKHSEEFTIVGDIINIKNKREWEEKEHREVEVNSVFESN